MKRLLLSFGLSVVLIASALGQAGPTSWPVLDSVNHLGFDNLNRENLNLSFAVPIFGRRGRGLGFAARLTYNSDFWLQSGGAWIPSGLTPGWVLGVAGNLSHSSAIFATCGYAIYDDGGNVIGYDKSIHLFREYNYIFTDGGGVPHPFGGEFDQGNNDPTTDCPSPSAGLSLDATDNSGYGLNVDGNGDATVTSTAGSVIAPWSATDRNGNQLTWTVNSVFDSATGKYNDTWKWYDTLNPSTPVLTLAGEGTPASPLIYTYTANGASQQVTEKFTSVSIATSFGCSNVKEYNGSVDLPNELDLPDGTKYMFGYDSAGLVNSITLPTSGTIGYTRTWNCAGGTPSLSRNDGAGTWTWTQIVSSTVQTTEKSPVGDTNTFNFLSDGLLSSAQLGSAASLSYCYNGNCNAVPGNGAFISQRQVAESTGGSPQLTRQQTTSFNGFGLPTELDETDWGTPGSGSPGPLLRKTLTTYAALNNIVGLPASVVVEDGSGAQKAATCFGYDAGIPASTSGVANHVAAPGVARGNLTSVQRLLSGSCASAPVGPLTTWTFDDTGQPLTSTDPSGQKTSYSYSDSYAGAQPPAATNAFPTTVTLPSTGAINHIEHFTYLLESGAVASKTDQNGNVTGYSYADPLGRLTAVTAADNSVTSTNYTGNTFEQVLAFNNNQSTEDVLVTLDGFGRPVLRQKRQAPGSSYFDSVQTSIDGDGRVTAVTVPYIAAAGALAPNGTPETTTTFDALSRPLTVTDGGGGTEAYAYTGNDVLTTIGPAPANENPKRTQREYDGLGRLQSVCEVTGATGAGTCGQMVAQTGYWTRYARDTLGDITQVVQNAQGAPTETRSFVFDALARLTSESNPESGTAYYYYDGDSTCGKSFGDLLRRVDANGNTTCYAYDALHRLTGVSYPSGPNAGATPAKTFVYDSGAGFSFANAPGYNSANQVGQLVLAFTGSGNGPATQVGFGYDVMGRRIWAADFSQNSKTWLVTSETYFPNGAVSGLTVPGLAAVAYGLDGEGRPNIVSVGGAQIASASFGAFGPVSATLPGGSDSYQHDPATGRLTQFSFAAAGGTDTGALSWNPNGSLRQLAVNDTIPGTVDSQTCSYSHDDLGRIAAANCGSAWSQGFVFDPFGNLVKSGSISFGQAGGYNQKNQIAINGGFTPNYDGDGNLLDDPVIPTRNANVYDAEGRPVTLEGNSFVYDALERRVAAPPGDYAYLPDGRLAAEVGSTSAEFVVLPGGDTAAYQNGSLQYVRRSDWLGSGRLLTNPTGGLFWSTAYAPYGETYASAGPAAIASFASQTLWDTSTANYGFPMREYNGIQGRWWSPDPAGHDAVDPNRPQTWNRYAYVTGNPLGATDPTGLDEVLYQPHQVSSLGCKWDGIETDCGGVNPQDSVACGEFCDGVVARFRLANDLLTWYSQIFTFGCDATEACTFSAFGSISVWHDPSAAESIANGAALESQYQQAYSDQRSAVVHDVGQECPTCSISDGQAYYQGGHWNWVVSGLLVDRYDTDEGSLHVHTNPEIAQAMGLPGSTLFAHADSYNGNDFPIGTILHGGKDVIWGSLKSAPFDPGH